MSILSKLCDGHVLDIYVNPLIEQATFVEMCDNHFEVNLTPQEIREFADELMQIANELDGAETEKQSEAEKYKEFLKGYQSLNE